MSDEISVKVQDLLEKGLYYYGLGETQMAVNLWKQVLAIDPENEMAREYLEIELGASSARSTPRPPDAAQAPARAEKKEMPQSFVKGQQLIYAGKPVEAVENFTRAYEESNGRLYNWAYVELAKTSLIKYIMEQAGSFSNIPELTRPMSELAKMNFSEEEGFILSLITGDVSLEDVISLSPLPKYKTYRAIYRFIQDDIVRIKRA